VVCVLMNIELIVISTTAFFILLGLVAYGAQLEQKYKNLQNDYDDLKKKKEKQ
jgi:high-affinity Fe2+/Pb2+ permease